MSVHLLGIRHHGVGSARNVVAYLNELQPDIILVEGPPEGEVLLSGFSVETFKPPVALLAYIPDQPQKASFYPFAAFSPEWQALAFAQKRKIPIRFFDLPLCHAFAIDLEEQANLEKLEAYEPVDSDPASNSAYTEEAYRYSDPFQHFAEIDGMEDGEAWWDLNFESRNENAQIFEAVKLSVTTLRSEIKERNNPRENLREAWMRKVLRQTEKEGFQKIAVVCGAWHVPALEGDIPSQKADNEILKNLPKVKIETTWIPWTYNRLTYKSGYGAGIHSPGWYHHLWEHTDDDGTIWMGKIAQLLRQKRVDTSVAHVIESVRLAQALAALRNRHRAGLPEFNEATTSIMGFGDEIILQLIKEQLIVSDRIGEVPTTVPKVPLLLDLERLQRKLRMPADAGVKEYTLDLRQENDLSRSILLHRLNLLNITWGHIGKSTGKGTFKEVWILQWQPEISIHVIEKGVWGNTIEEAASNLLIHESGNQTDVVKLSEILDSAVPADLPQAVKSLILRLEKVAATATDVLALMRTIPNLAQISRYGNVRNTDTEMVVGIAKALITRTCIGLPLATIGIDETASQELQVQLSQVNQAISLLQLQEETEQWNETLKGISENDQAHPLIAGFATRLLFDGKIVEHEQVATRLSYSLSTASEPMQAAYWAEGFLSGSGTLLLLDEALWEILYRWVSGLEEEVFMQLLPLLRRTFSNYTPAERYKIGEKAKLGKSLTPVSIQGISDSFDYEKGIKGAPVILQIFNLLP